MASVKYDNLKISITQSLSETVLDTERVVEPADFEVDHLLSRLRVDEWFAMAEEGMPIWVC